jgi:hypothetical protein
MEHANLRKEASGPTGSQKRLQQGGNREIGGGKL